MVGSAERPSAVPWPPLLLIGALALAVALGAYAPLPWPGEADSLTTLAGALLIAGATALFVWAALTLRRHGTTILPDQPASQLVMDGPYRWRRNPIYLAHVLFLIGLSMLTVNIWFAALGLIYAVLVTWLAILPEEAHLEAKFGDAFTGYKSRTRRWL